MTGTAADRGGSRLSSSLAELDIAVLAGGLGTRMGTTLGGLPKVLAPVGGRPYLDILLDGLAGQGARRVVLCLGHKAAPVLGHLERAAWEGLEIVPLVEPEPLGTAGALAHARARLDSDPVLVMNGDTFVDASLDAFVRAYRASRAEAMILCVRVTDARRYGRVEIDDRDRIQGFREKGGDDEGPAWINAGVYAFGRAFMDRIAWLGRGSLERDLLQTLAPGVLAAFRADCRFIDLGTPQSLARAAEVVPATAARPRRRPRPATPVKGRPT